MTNLSSWLSAPSTYHGCPPYPREFWHPVSGILCMEVPLLCSDALTPHTRSLFNMDTLLILLWLWHPTPGHGPLWIPSSLNSGPDFPHWASPLCGHPCYSSWVLCCKECPLQHGHPSHIVWTLCPMLGAFLCGYHSQSTQDHCDYLSPSMDVYLGFRIKLLVRKRRGESHLFLDLFPIFLLCHPTPLSFS